MHLDEAVCYRAVVSRDQRFDGRFFAGVVTTRIYCRSICPVPAARPENFRWFACAAAAEAAGFRPCRRCRPEAAPGTPAWLGASSVVRRALRLIGEGALDDRDVESLATTLGIGARQLRRLFVRHLGATPAAVAGARRVHFAAKLLAETALPITEVAFATGFTSVRQFNHAFRARFEQSPTQVRRQSQTEMPVVDAGSRGNGLIVRLAYRGPLDWRTLFRFLGPRATPGVEVVESDSYHRTIELSGVVGTVEVRPILGASQLMVRVRLPTYEGLSQVVERVRRLFDLGADPLLIADHLGRSPQLRPLIHRWSGIRVPGVWDDFELVVRAMLGEQLSAVRITRLAGRLVQTFGKRINVGDRLLTHTFPGPDVLADADLSRLGLSRPRADAVRRVAMRIASGALSLETISGSADSLQRLADVDDTTAQYIALRSLGDPDAFPAGDICLRRALADGGKPFAAGALECLAEAWKPWRSYAAMYLWRAQS